MYTAQGKFFTGEKTYWHAESNTAGVVSQIVFAVKAWDNEGRKFQGDSRALTREEMDSVMSSASAHAEFIDKEISKLYHAGLAAEAVVAAVKAKEAQDAKRDSDSHIS